MELANVSTTPWAKTANFAQTTTMTHPGNQLLARSKMNAKVSTCMAISFDKFLVKGQKNEMILHRSEIIEMKFWYSEIERWHSLEI